METSSNPVPFVCPCCHKKTTGYLQAQSDHAGLFKYKKALGEGKSKAEAKKISRTSGKKN